MRKTKNPALKIALVGREDEKGESEKEDHSMISRRHPSSRLEHPTKYIVNLSCRVVVENSSGFHKINKS